MTVHLVSTVLLSLAKYQRQLQSLLKVDLEIGKTTREKKKQVVFNRHTTLIWRDTEKAEMFLLAITGKHPLIHIL